MTAEAIVDVASWWTEVLSAQSVNVGVIFFLVLLATRLLRRWGPAFHLVLWTLVFVRLLLPPGVSHPWSVGALVERLFPTAARAVSHEAGWIQDGAVGSTGETGVLSGKSGVRRAPVGFAGAWLLGAVVALAVYKRRLKPFYERVRTAKPAVIPVVVTTAERWRRRLRIRRKVRVVTSSARITPFTLGVVRPVIFLPCSIISDRRLVESVLAHEMVHVARLDALWLGLQHLLQAVYFFHPLVWIAGLRLDAERERLCDATVVAAGRIPARTYVRGILDVLQLELQEVPAPTVTARKRRIGMRIKSALERDGARQPRLALAVAVAVLLGIIVLPLAAGHASAGSTPKIESSRNKVANASEARSIELGNPLPGGRVTWQWGPGRDPWTENEVFHSGIDVAAKAGTPVLAPADGVVIVATESFDESPASGTVIMIDHGDGWTTFFAHLGSLDVSVDQKVSRNDAIAKVGSTGKSTGPHVHFEVRRDGEPQNPADYVSDWK